MIHLKYIKITHFESSDKTDELLARQIKRVQDDRVIHKISSPTGQLITDSKMINDRFFSYYTQPLSLRPLMRT